MGLLLVLDLTQLTALQDKEFVAKSEQLVQIKMEGNQRFEEVVDIRNPHHFLECA